MTVHDSEGRPIEGATDDNSGYGTGAQLLFLPEHAGTYYVEVQNSSAASTPDVGQYEVCVVHYDDVGAGSVGTFGDDVLNGDSLPNNMFGLAGNDTINGHDGNDRLWGGNDDDLLDGGAGDDRLRGGDGADTLDGGAGRDILQGEDGADTLYGGAENDDLFGDAGADTLEGGAGNDRLFGGAGADVFKYSPIITDDETVLPFGDDVIYGFALGDGDTIDIVELVEYYKYPAVYGVADENGYVKLVFNESDGTPVGSITLHGVPYFDRNETSRSADSDHAEYSGSKSYLPDALLQYVTSSYPDPVDGDSM